MCIAEYLFEKGMQGLNSEYKGQYYSHFEQALNIFLGIPTYIPPTLTLS